MFSSGEDKTLAGLVLGSVVTFALNVNDGSIWANGLMVAPKVATAAWDAYRKANQPAPEPEPTPSVRTKPWEDARFIAKQKEMARQWDICKADAKVIGCKPEQVQRFKAQRKLDHDRPLSVDAQQLLRDELENDQRTAKVKPTLLNNVWSSWPAGLMK